VGGWGEPQFRRGAYTAYVVLFICTYFVGSIHGTDENAKRRTEFTVLKAL
jgi:hypothetical protein